jgi:precorrin-6A/cobalt-precorrin-6A reductase
MGKIYVQSQRISSLILILGGTSESREIAVHLLQEHAHVLYASTTAIIKNLPEDIQRFTGMLTYESLVSLAQNKKIFCIIDATHPFAVTISQLAMEISKQMRIPYIRFERKSINNLKNEQAVQCVTTIKQAAEIARSKTGTIFSTIGTRLLPELFQNLGNRKNDLLVRILPLVSSISLCETLGIHPSRILAMQGPFPLSFNLYCINHYNVKVMISKESGEQAWLQSKIDACNKTGCLLLILQRPVLNYPVACHTINECSQLLIRLLPGCK